MKKERTKCERFSRIVGYLRPLQDWHEGKKAEWHDRIMFNTQKLNSEKEVKK